jgi:23S rRNA U2552 (ribose-2'-O)-methylase RlmE/FtsJ
MFDLVPLDKDNFVSAHLAEGPGSFIQATMFYRDMFAKKGLSKNDKYHAVTLHPEDIRKHIPPLGESFVKYYAKEKPNRFMQHRTVPKKVAKQSGGKRDNGDITKRSTIKLFADDMKGKKAHFITADGGFEWKNENTQEQEAFKLILGQIIAALKIQAPSGNFVIKMFESFTSTSVKFMCILSSFYEHVYAVKPLTSRKSNSEKYIVCLGYNGANKDKKIAELEGVLDQFIKNKGMQLVDVYPDYEIPKDYMATVTKLNTTVANRQFESINEIVAFIEKQNYRGEEYHTRRKMQIDASEYWIDTFYPKQSEFTNKKKQIQKSRDGLVQYNANLATVLASKLN